MWGRARSAVDQLRLTADRRAAVREAHADLIRAVAVAAVVLGHWLLMAVTVGGADLDGVNALRDLRWAHPLTWVFQVMPLFFLVGGYANAASFDLHMRAGGDRSGWVLSRYDRLLRPTVALLGALVIAVVVAGSFGVDRDRAATGAWVATLPMWFLLIYLTVVALGPWALVAQRRWGLAVPAALAVLVAAGDVARYCWDADWVAESNYVAAWLAIHQLGVAWYEGRLRTRPSVGVPLAAGALATTTALIWLGPYPVSMVSVPGADQNSDPPTLALLGLAATQAGLVLALRDRATRWLRSPRRWLLVTCVNRVVMTLFLWHMTAGIVAAIGLYGTGALAVEPIGSAPWLLGRIPWVLTCAAVLAVLAALFAPIELAVPGVRIGARVRSRTAALALAIGVTATLAGLLGIALAGRGEHGPLGLPTWALASVAVGVVVLVVIRQTACVPGERPQ